jgi:Flp pilus assembly pilin Flp
MRKLLALKRNEAGAAMIEYVVICGLILAVTIALITAIGGNVTTIFEKINSATSAAATATR